MAGKPKPRLVKLKQRDVDSCKRAIAATLDEVKEADPDSIVVFYQKDGQIFTRSEFMGRLELLGALRAAEQEVWDAGTD